MYGLSPGKKAVIFEADLLAIAALWFWADLIRQIFLQRCSFVGRRPIGLGLLAWYAERHRVPIRPIALLENQASCSQALDETRQRLAAQGMGLRLVPNAVCWDACARIGRPGFFPFTWQAKKSGARELLATKSGVFGSFWGATLRKYPLRHMIVQTLYQNYFEWLPKRAGTPARFPQLITKLQPSRGPATNETRTVSAR